MFHQPKAKSFAQLNKGNEFSVFVCEPFYPLTFNLRCQARITTVADILPR